MKKYQYIAIALGAVLFASCDDMLTTHYEGGTQDDDYIQATVEANPERVNSAVSGMYQVIKQPLGYFGSSNRADDCGYVACRLTVPRHLLPLLLRVLAPEMKIVVS